MQIITTRNMNGLPIGGTDAQLASGRIVHGWKCPGIFLGGCPG